MKQIAILESPSFEVILNNIENYLEEFILEDLAKKPEYELITELTGPNKNNVVQGEFIGIIDGTKLTYTDIIDALYRTVNVYTEMYKLLFSDIVRNYGNKLTGMFLSSTYRTIKNYTVRTNTSTTTDIELFGLFKSPADITTLITNFKSAVDAAIDNVNLTREVFEFFDSSPNEELYNSKSEDILKPLVKELVSDKIDEMFKYRLLESVEHDRNEIIRLTDKLNFIVEYGHDAMISGDTYTQATLNGFAPDLFYNEYKPVIEYFTTLNQNIIPQIDTSLNFSNFDLLVGALDAETLKDIIFPMIKNKKLEIVDPYTLDDVFNAEAVENVNGVFDFQVNLHTYTGHTFNFAKAPIKPNTKKIEYEIISQSQVTDDAEGLVINKIFINKNNPPANDKLNYYEP